LRELTTTQQIRALREGRITIGFIRASVNDEMLAIETILSEQFVVALPEHHALSALPHLSLRALSSEPIILFPRHLGPGFYDQIVSMCHEAGFSPNVVQEAIEMQTIVSLVAAEIGVAIVPASLQYLRRVGVIYKNIEDAKDIPAAEIAMIWRKEDTSPILQAFLRVARAKKTA
jgi:DNA-binding transcriptional LysR family regulator